VAIDPVEARRNWATAFGATAVASPEDAGGLDPTGFTTHWFPLDRAMDAYDTFARAGETNALKALLTGNQAPGDTVPR
jgi:Zn-dependent alcohol dehydrogenase